MASTAELYASGTPVTGNEGAGTWANTSAATGAPDSAYATYTGDQPADAWIVLSGYAAQAAVGSPPSSVDSVDVTVYLHFDRATHWAAWAVGLFDGPDPATANVIGAYQTFTGADISVTASFSKTVSFTGITYAQLASLSVYVQVDKQGFHGTGIASLDAAGAKVNYTP